MKNVNPLSPPVKEEFKIESIGENEVSEDLEEELEEEFEEELEEEEMDDLEYFDTFPTKEELEYHEWLLKYPRPSWVSAKRVRGLKVFVGNFTYECDFVVLEDTSSVTDHYLGGIVLGKPFVKASGHVYDKNKGTVIFEKENERIIFKMPHKIERFRNIEDLNTDNIPSFIEAGDDNKESDKGHENRNKKTYYSESLNLGLAYKRDESVTRAIKCLIKMKSSVSNIKESRKE
ncbi:hypothetical protein Tco_0034185 [Tanacetum coccineum]